MELDQTRAQLRAGMDGLALFPTPPHTQVTSPSSAYRKNDVNFENDLTTTVAASEDSDHLPQRLALSGSQQAVANVVTTWLSGTRNWCEGATHFQALGNECEATIQLQVLKSVC